jgi:cysteine desulfurase
MSAPVYLDYQATTPVDPRVLDAMMPYLREQFGNPSAANAHGEVAKEAVEKARDQVARLIGAQKNEIFFTSGATESVNIALRGLFEMFTGSAFHLITVATEHKCVLDTCAYLGTKGAGISVLPVDSFGRIDPAEIAAAIRPETRVVSVMAANNEIGTIHNLTRIAEITRKSNLLFHTDITQAAGRIPVNLSATAPDLSAFSAHKLYGPKGVGALFIRRDSQARAIPPLMTGGGQEQRRRPGTLNVPAIVGFGAAAEIAQMELTAESKRIQSLCERLQGKLFSAFPDIKLNGPEQGRLPGNLNISFPGLEGEAILLNTPLLAMAAGSACTATDPLPSHVIRALGFGSERATSAIRISIGRFTTESQIDFAADKLISTVQKLSAHHF